MGSDVLRDEGVSFREQANKIDQTKKVRMEKAIRLWNAGGMTWQEVRNDVDPEAAEENHKAFVQEVRRYAAKVKTPLRKDKPGNKGKNKHRPAMQLVFIGTRKEPFRTANWELAAEHLLSRMPNRDELTVTNVFEFQREEDFDKMKKEEERIRAKLGSIDPNLIALLAANKTSKVIAENVTITRTWREQRQHEAWKTEMGLK